MRFVYFGLDFFAKWSELEEALEEHFYFQTPYGKIQTIRLGSGGGGGDLDSINYRKIIQTKRMCQSCEAKEVVSTICYCESY